MNPLLGTLEEGIKRDRDYYRSDMVDYFWVMGEDGELKCQDCPEEERSINEDEDERGKIIINEDGVDIDLKDGADSFKMKIDEDGVQIKAGDKNDN